MPEKPDWETVGFLLSSEIRREVLRTLNEGRSTPSHISTILHEPISHVSHALKELQDRKLAICLTPDRKKGRLYQITTLGEGVLRELDSVQPEGGRD